MARIIILREIEEATMSSGVVSCLSQHCATHSVLVMLMSANNNTNAILPARGPALPGNIGYCVLCARRAYGRGASLNRVILYANLYGEYPADAYVDMPQSKNAYVNGMLGPMVRWNVNDYELVIHPETNVATVRQKFDTWINLPLTKRKYDQSWLKHIYHFDPNPPWPDDASRAFSLMVCDNTSCKHGVLSHLNQCYARGGKLAALDLSTNEVVCIYCKSPVVHVSIYEPSSAVQLITVKNVNYCCCSICATPVEFNNRYAVQMCTVCDKTLAKKAKLNENVCFCCRRPANGPARQGAVTYMVDGKKLILCRVHRLRGADGRRDQFTLDEFMASLRGR